MGGQVWQHQNGLSEKMRLSMITYLAICLTAAKKMNETGTCFRIPSNYCVALLLV